jgi:two-component system, OmpR family, alkaline phosphatase synthesis response regulator PhoP
MTHRILICDDEPHVTRLMSLKLSHAGYEVHTAADGEAAWRVMQDWVPALVITDEDLPRLSGRELIARMRRSSAFDHIPVVLLSGQNVCDIADRARLAQLHVAEQVHKPFSPRQLIEDVKHLLELEDACPLETIPA